MDVANPHCVNFESSWIISVVAHNEKLVCRSVVSPCMQRIVNDGRVQVIRVTPLNLAQRAKVAQLAEQCT